MTPTPVLPSLPHSDYVLAYEGDCYGNEDRLLSEIGYSDDHTQAYGLECYELGKAHAIESLSRAPAEPECVPCVHCGHKNWVQDGKAPAQIKPPTESAGPSSPMTLAEATREVGKWLNEEPNRPVDRHALAVMSAACQRLVEPAESAGPAPAGMLLVSEAALRQIARAIEGLKRECGMDPESPQAIRNAQYMSLAYAVRKLGESHE